MRLPSPSEASWALGGAALLALAVAAAERGAPGSLLPHGYCFVWNPALLWTHVVSDAAIGCAYVTIPVTLLHLVRKRTDLPFNWIVVLFAVFIVSCGATHWIEVWTVWRPDYWFSATVKVITATASVLTAAALVHLVPKILTIPTVEELRTTKEALEKEVAVRRRVEEELRQERAVLEDRVAARTRELAQATQRVTAAYASAEEANRQKDRFFAKVSHELRTPLQATLTWAHILKRQSLPPERLAHASARIAESVNTQARLIDDLLDISRILSGKLELNFQTVRPIDVIEKAIDVVRASPVGANRQIVFVPDDALTPLTLATDPVRLEQIVWNLASNALRSTGENGEPVRVSARVHDNQLELTVEDSGKGISKEDLEHIFEPFRQGVTETNAHRGMGLGLAITRSIVDLFGGHITAFSNGPGKGARFVVRLPLHQIAAQGTQMPGGSSALSPADLKELSGLSVLYVEDDLDIAEGIQTMLVEMGVKVQVCVTFEQGRQRVRDGGFDLLISDLGLDDNHTGFELLRLLRERPHGSATPAIALSAYGAADDLRASHGAGFIAHLVKPVSVTDLARSLISGRRLLRPPD